MNAPEGWPLYEIFIRARGGLDHKHVGSVHAVDARMALEHARDVYTRRTRRREHLGGADPARSRRQTRGTPTRMFEPARDKIYRHPTFYEIPDEVKTL